MGPAGTKPVPENTNGKGYGGLVGGETIAQLITGTNNPPFYLNSSDAIVPGSYTVTGTGGSNVGSFSAGITVTQNAANFKWTNQAAVTGSDISRTQPLTITWSGGDTNGFVDITAIASTLNTSFPSKTTPGMLVESTTTTIRRPGRTIRTRSSCSGRSWPGGAQYLFRITKSRPI